MPRRAFLVAMLSLGAGAAEAQTAPGAANPTTASPTTASPTPWRLGQALDQPDGVRISGAIRGRYEALGNPFVAGRTEDDEYLGIQTVLDVEVDVGGTGLTIGGELLDSRFIAGNETGGVATEIDTLEPSQLYLAWRPHDFLMDGAKLDLTLGRFTMDAGSRRLVARSLYRNILSSFDGVRAVWTSPDKLAVTLAYTAPVARAPADAASAIDNEVALNKTLNTTRFAFAQVDQALPFGLRGDLYVIDLDENDSSDVATRNRKLTTAGFRIRKSAAPEQVDFEVELALQTGTVRATTSAADVIPLDHDAQMGHLETGYSFSAPWSPRIALQYDYATGDKSPADTHNERFDTLFGDRAFDLGPTSIYGLVLRSNLSSPAIRIEVKPDAASEAYVSLRHLQLEAGRDSFANTAVRDATGASGKDIGLQVEGRYRHWLMKDSLRLSVGAAMLFEGDFMKNAPNATRQGDPVYGFSELTWIF
jgi:hypothetical protein